MTLSTACRHSYRTATLALVCLLAVTNSDAAVVGTTTVTSVTHAFATHPQQSFSETADYLALFNFPSGPSLTANLDSDTAVSYSLSAPTGDKFVVHVPAGESAFMFSTLTWDTPIGDTLAPASAFAVSFGNLVGAAPAFSNNAAVGNYNNYFDFSSQSANFSTDMSFTSITFTTSYLPRTGHGPLTYQPGTTSFFAIAYDHNGIISDPGPFVSLVSVPEPTSILLASAGGALVAGLALWRRRFRSRSRVWPAVENLSDR